MEQQVVTVKEVIDMTISELRGLSIPAEYLDSMGPPVSRALNNLKALENFLEEQEKKDNQNKIQELIPEDAEPVELG